MILEHFAASFLQNTATELQPNFRFLLLGYRNRAEKFAAIVRYYRNRTETQKMRYLMGDPDIQLQTRKIKT